jgi:hypothetical protein
VITLLLIVIRVLVILMVLRFVLRLIASARTPRSRGPLPRQKPVAERTGGTLVRDPNCGMYIPESGSITVGSGSAALHFCSVSCRDAHAAAHQGRKSSGSALRTQ